MTADLASAPSPRAGTPPTRELLASVSRSFYLSLRVLPRGMREPVSLAYLLARLTDTVADSSRLPPDRRGRWLGDLRALLTGEREYPADAGWLAELAGELAPTVEHAGERELVLRSAECVGRLARLDEGDRREVRRVLGTIVAGQQLDVERFEGQGRSAERGPGADGSGLVRARVMPDAGALRDYTYAVAGCVGRFWTRMCHLHAPGWHDSGVDADELEDWGEQLGRGLQLINILRDAPADVAAGRCYLPLGEGAAGGRAGSAGAGLAAEVAWPKERWLSRLAAVAPPWMDECGARLEAGARYVAATRHRRLRLAAALPWLLAERTLARVRGAAPESWAGGIKVPRSEVRSLLRRAGWRVLLGLSMEPLRPEVGGAP